MPANGPGMFMAMANAIRSGAQPQAPQPYDPLGGAVGVSSGIDPATGQPHFIPWGQPHDRLMRFTPQMGSIQPTGTGMGGNVGSGPVPGATGGVPGSGKGVTPGPFTGYTPPPGGGAPPPAGGGGTPPPAGGGGSFGTPGGFGPPPPSGGGAAPPPTGDHTGTNAHPSYSGPAADNPAIYANAHNGYAPLDGGGGAPFVGGAPGSADETLVQYAQRAGLPMGQLGALGFFSSSLPGTTNAEKLQSYINQFMGAPNYGANPVTQAYGQG